MLQVAMVSVHTCPLARLGSRETGGMNVYIRELSRRLGARGVAVDVFTRMQDRDVPQIVEFGENVRVIHLPAGPTTSMDKYDVVEHLPDFLDGVAEFRLRSGRRYDIVHSHYWLSSPVAVSLSRQWRAPLVTMFHTLGRMKNRVSHEGSETESEERIAIERQTMLASDRIVAVSPADMEQMLDHYEAPESRLRVVPGGVDSTLFAPFPRDAARALLGLGNEPLVLFVGRIQRLKGIDLLLGSFRRLLADWKVGPLPRLMVVGGDSSSEDGDPETVELSRMKRLASELGVADRVSFKGAVPHLELPRHYSAADIVVVPSLYESFGLVALESMACGTPVVASAVGGLRGTVRHGKTGLLVKGRSEEQFASAMATLLLDDELRSRMSRGAVEAAGAYSWDVAADRTLQIYRELVPCHCGGVATCRA
jgi:D-inositol-3-phosphate glycosyltransferase